ncbi:uncharacterized protein LOC117639901 isoform X2 [Thrips palmi]|uniref:Uncharacterized protein LOC117639901 isoform X2 n=1 Tax=Thrips palmi TaxID=161013 RepID=A0A6P8XXH4_THRPL|nr:uncharacterized protein LOC117639901 isoform X2 [Thrips palmi]
MDELTPRPTSSLPGTGLPARLRGGFRTCDICGLRRLIMDCDICLEKLDTTQRRPKALPCGHTTCLLCVGTMDARACPQCRQVFAGPVESLPDNFYVLKLIEEIQQLCADQRLLLWCRDCSKVASEQCVDLGHVLCSLRKMRSERAAEQQQWLADCASVMWSAVKSFEDAERAVQALLKDWRSGLRQVEAAQRALQAAAGVDDDRNVDVEFPQAQWAQLLRELSSLLQGLCVEVEPQSGAGPQCASHLLQDAVRRGVLLFDLLKSFSREDDLSEVKKLDGTQAEVTFSPDECLDFTQLSPVDYKQKMDHVLDSPDFNKVRQLVGLGESYGGKELLLLHRSRAHVERLQIALQFCPVACLPKHLEAIRLMPALRHLELSFLPDDSAVPELPLQLEGLDLKNVHAEHLQHIQRMPRLRKLALDWCEDPLDVAFPPLPPGHCGLRWLWVALRPLSTVLSLAKAHAATLQDLRITCASEGDTPWHFKDLAAGLRLCGLTALRSVVLLRDIPDDADDVLLHGRVSCINQRRAVWTSVTHSLLAVADSSKPLNVPKVLCGECDEYPAYPARGMPWEDN